MSYEIIHEVGVKALPEEVFQFLTEPALLAKWWVSDTRGSGSAPGDVLEFWMSERFCQHFKVTALTPNRLVQWEGAEGVDEWKDTRITFQLSADDKQTLVGFQHSGWKENAGIFAHCSTKWATFLLSLKDAMETGKGRPSPNDVPIGHS